MAGGQMSDPSSLSGDMGFMPSQVGPGGLGGPMFGGLQNMFKKHGAAPGIGQINPANISTGFGESDPMGTMPGQPKPAIDPQMLQLMLSMRGMGGGAQQPMQMPPAAPGPQIQPGGLMGAMPGQAQGGFRPRGMAGRF